MILIPKFSTNSRSVTWNRLVCALLMLCLSQLSLLANTKQDEPPVFIDISSMIADAQYENPAEDIFFTQESLVVFERGHGQACYDGFFYSINHSNPDSEMLTELSLGENSLLSKNEGVYSSYPDLAAVTTNGDYIINLVCNAKFPGVYQQKDGLFVTGNVILYSPPTDNSVLLTHLNGKERRFARAEELFPNGWVLIREYSMAQGCFPRAGKDVLSAYFINPGTGERKELDSLPSNARWYYESKDIYSLPLLHDQEANTSTWRINWQGQQSIIIAGGIWEEPAEVLYVSLSCEILLVSHEAFGTMLIDRQTHARIIISELPLVSFDLSRCNAVVGKPPKTPGSDRETGCYYAVDLQALLHHLQGGLVYSVELPESNQPEVKNQ